MRKEMGSFVVGDSTKCTGCRACELACFTVHGSRSNHIGKTVGTVTIPVTPRLFLTKFEQGCMPIQCKHCENAPCLNVCTKGAISRIDHQVVVDADRCIGCKDCMQACPFGAIALLPHAKDGRLVAQAVSEEPKVFAAKCDLCSGIEGDRRVSVSVRIRRCAWWSRNLSARKKNIRAAEALLLTKNWK